MPETYGSRNSPIYPCENCGVTERLEWHDGWLCEACHKAVEEALARIAKEREPLAKG